MKTVARRNSALALVGLAALVIYVLACTSFSPDNQKVLYPAFDRQTGAVGIWVYDRPSARSEPAFIPGILEQEKASTLSLALRPSWTSDGRWVVVVYPGQPMSGGDDDGLNLAVVPFGSRGPVRMFYLPELEETAKQLIYPVAVCDSRVFVSGQLAGTNALIRLNLVTGEWTRRPLSEELALFPGGRGDRVFYLRELGGQTNKLELGSVNPDTLDLTPRFELPTPDDADEGAVTVSYDGAKVASFRKDQEQFILSVHQAAQGPVEVILPAGDRYEAMGCMVFGPKGDRVYAPCQRAGKQEGTRACGLLEIPLNGQPPRFVALFEPDSDLEDALVYFQVGVSSDGKAAALASTYLALQHEKLKPSDCALFLIDLSDARRKVTKVPVPLPVVPRAPTPK
jgi:hypothetical protein